MILICVFLIYVCHGDGTLDLYNHLFKHYRKEIRPVDSKNPSSTNVTVQLFLKQIQKVHESDQVLSLYCWLELYWTDNFLRWNESEFDGVQEIIVPAAQIWRPDLLVYNNAHMDIEGNQMETNAQECYIMLSSWSYSGAEIMLDTLISTEKDNSQTDLSSISALAHYMENQEWQLNDFKTKRNLKYYECCPSAYPDITFYFTIRRNPIYYLFTQLLPSTFISVITMIGSFSPHHTTGENQEKVTLGATAGMAIVIILMMIADKLPATSNTLPLLGKFYVGLILMIFFATISTTWIMNIQMKGNQGQEIPGWLRLATRRSRFMRLIFKNISGKKKHKSKDCLCMSRSRSNSFILKSDNTECRWFAPPYNAIGADPIYQKILLTIGDIRTANQITAERLEAEHRLHEIRAEWAYVARGLDKIFLFLFVAFTVLYQLWLFTQTTTTIRMVSEQFMNQTST
ncbi:AcetylCholine Receptor [Aphelenchoides bicaudatus]|nr:AcetylCholine Receptor [Aphelenchoides bicaudatus]